jgi:hypothetical protein
VRLFRKRLISIYAFGPISEPVTPVGGIGPSPSRNKPHSRAP